MNVGFGACACVSCALVDYGLPLPACNSSVCVGVFIKSGSRYETDESNGSAHFLEHMFFKGSKNKSQNQLELDIENMGCRLNAYTSREQTVYYANVIKEDTGKAVDILAEMLLNSTFDPAAIEREKNTILQEMESVERIDEEVVFDNRKWPSPHESSAIPPPHRSLSPRLPHAPDLARPLHAPASCLRCAFLIRGFSYSALHGLPDLSPWPHHPRA